VARLEQRTVERPLNLRLQPHLFVKPNLQVRQQHELRLLTRIGCPGRPLVVTKCLLQHVLPLRRRPRLHASAEVVHLGVADSSDVGEARQPPREKRCDLCKYLIIALTYKLGRPSKWTEFANRINNLLQEVNISLCKQLQQLRIQ